MGLPSNVLQRLRAWLEYPLSSAPAISGNGHWLYFISNRGGIPQAWGCPITGGAPSCLYSARENVGQIEASPEGSAAVISVDRGGDEHWQLFVRDGSGAEGEAPLRALTHDPSHIHRPGAWRDGRRFVFSANVRDERFFDVFEVAAANGGAPLLLRQEDALITILAARGERVLLTRSNTNLDSDLILLESGREQLLTPHTEELTVWSADLVGPDVLAGANPDREFAALMRYRPGAAPEALREFGADVELVKGEPAGNRAALSVNRGGWSELHVIDLRTNEDRVLSTPGPGLVSSIAWIPGGDGFAFGFDSPTSGQEIWRCDLRSGSTTPITKSPAPMPGPVVEPSLHSTRAEDGLEIPYWEYAPDSGTPRGTLVVVHGGPEAQSRPSFAAGMFAFLVGEGWRVVDPNVRGSTGYGRTYVHLDDVRRRMDSVRDLRDLVRGLSSEGKARLGEVGVFGGSYGGFMVLSAITTYPELFGAGVEWFGIANFVTFLERTASWRRKLRECEYGSLEHDRELLEAISPIHHVDRIVTPLLVAHGENDPRVAVGEAEQIVEALRKRGVPVEFLRYANEGHGFTRIENLVDSFGRTAAFFARHLPRPRPEG